MRCYLFRTRVSVISVTNFDGFDKKYHTYCDLFMWCCPCEMKRSSLRITAVAGQEEALERGNVCRIEYVAPERVRGRFDAPHRALWAARQRP